MRLKLSALVLCLCTTATVQADVIIGNLPPVNDEDSTAFGISGRAIGFTMTKTMRLTSARLRLISFEPTYAPTLSLMSDSGNNPNTVLATFQNPALGLGLANYVFTLQTPFELASGSSYWLTLSPNTSTPGGLLWRASTVSATPTGSSATYLGTRSIFSSIIGPSLPINSFELIGFAPPPAAVPEPSAIATLSAAVLGLGLCTRFRRRRGAIYS